MVYRYAAQNVDPEVTSKAVGRDVPVKPKFGINVARFLKGKGLVEAKAYLEDVIVLKRSIPFVTHKRHVKHRRDISGPGKYPVNTAKAFLKVIKDAESNAEYKGLDPEKMYVWHAVAHRGTVMPNYRPRAQGRATAWNKDTTNIEIVLRERDTEGEESERALSAADRKKAAVQRKKQKAKATKEE